MRGKVRVGEAYSRAYRITPAYAGKSNSGGDDLCPVQDHPRLCGEKTHPTHTAHTKGGSPPPMRGKGRQHCSGSRYLGITPAYAGKSRRRFLPDQNLRDHPRLCGEKSATTSGGMSGSGSPPPMRGKAFGGIHVVFRQGITPAYAGKSIGKEWCFLET